MGSPLPDAFRVGYRPVSRIVAAADSHTRAFLSIRNYQVKRATSRALLVSAPKPVVSRGLFQDPPHNIAYSAGILSFRTFCSIRSIVRVAGTIRTTLVERGVARGESARSPIVATS